MQDLKHYLALAALLSIGFGLFWVLNFNRQAQMGVAAMMGLVYILWGVVHHTLRKDFHWRLLFEYAAVAVLACTLVIFLLLRA